MTQLESFTTTFLEGQPGQYQETLAHAAQLSQLSLICLSDAFLKRLTVSFLQRVTRASLKNSFHTIGLLYKTRIFRPALRVLLANGLLALNAEIFLQLLISSFTEPY